MHKQYPGRYLTDVSGTAVDAIFENNPHRSYLDHAAPYTMHYPLIQECNQRPVHFLQGQVEYLGKVLGIPLVCNVSRPFLYLSDEEKSWENQVSQHHGYKGKFWLVCSGVKADYTVKGWSKANYQAVVNQLRGVVQFVQVGESGHNHPPLEGVLNLVGKTDTRQLIRLAYHAQGGLGGVSFLHHIFGALQKPFVTLASGMEPVAWEYYPTGRYLSRHGALTCCRDSACWKAKVVPDSSGHPGNVCSLPVFTPEPIPKCLAMIHPDEVVSAIRSFYEGGVITY